MTGHTRRLFVGFPVPDLVRDRLAQQLAVLTIRKDSVAWTRKDGWHVTLAFCGDVDDNQRQRVHAIVATIAATIARVELHVTGLAALSGHALVARLDDRPRGAIRASAGALQLALATADVPVRRRDVTAHITLARARADRSAFASCVRAAQSLAVDDVPSWQPSHLVVWESLLGAGPARYEVDFSAAVSD